MMTTVRGTLGCALVMCTFAVHAQEYPSRPIRIVTVETGSGQDVTARLARQGMSERLGQPVVVDNRGMVGINIVAKAPRDGHTVLIYGPTLWLGPYFQDKAEYDPIRDFAPVTLMVVSPNLLVIHPSVPAKSVKELIAHARERPGQLNYGSGSTGSNSHLAAELFKSMAGVSIVRVPYKGAGLALNDVVAGHVQLIIPSATSAAPHIKSGRVRALAVTSAQPSTVFPDLPTVAASLPGYESTAMTAMFVPAGTPAAVVARLNQDTVRSLASGEVRERLLSQGMEVVGSTPDDLAIALKREMNAMAKLIKDAGIRQ